MSFVTEVAIIAHFGEGTAIGALNAFLGQKPGEAAPLGPGFRLDAGPKASALAAWGGGFNYLYWDGFIEAARSAPWRFPDWVTIIRLGEGDDAPVAEWVTA